MISDDALIQLLADGQFHSGEELALQLKVSRTAVWKRLKKLSTFGLAVESVKGRGYRLPQPLELLNKEAIERYLPHSSQVLINKLILLPLIDSTNSYLLSVAKSNQALSKANVCLAEYQSGGRGRRGRQWISPYGSNLYLSIDWQFDGGVTALEGLSLAVGVVIVRAMSSFNLPDISLKWPNDILMEGSKLGGVLIEVVGDHAGPCRAVIGVGINVNMPDQELEIDQPWADLKNVSRNQLAAFLIRELTEMLVSFESDGLKAYMKEWQQLDAFNGKMVSVISGQNIVSGRCCGIADNGALVVDVDGVKQSMHGGELSLRLNDEP